MKNTKEIRNTTRTRRFKYLFTILISIISFNIALSQWNQIGSLSNIGSYPSISVVTDNIFFVAGGPNGTPVIYKTTNGGVSFTPVNFL